MEQAEAEEKLSRPSSVASSASLGSSLPLHHLNSFSSSLAALERQARSLDSSPKISQEVLRPFSREMSPDRKSEEPQDLSRGGGGEERQERGGERSPLESDNEEEEAGLGRSEADSPITEENNSNQVTPPCTGHT